MRKVLLAIVVLIILGVASIVIYTKINSQGSNERAAEYSKDKAYELKFKLPLGDQLTYDVEVNNLQKISNNEGITSFGVKVNMLQTMMNYSQTDESFEQFHMDLFKDIRVTEALKGKNILDAEIIKRNLASEERRFKHGSYVLNNSKMLHNGLPVKLPEIKKESQLAQGQLTFIQYFPGKKYKVGEKWEFTRKLGEFSLDYKFEFNDIVWFNDYLCGKIIGQVTCSSETKELVFQPTDFTIWLGIENNLVVASEITQTYKFQDRGMWVAIKMHLLKKLSKITPASPELMTFMIANAKTLVDAEKGLRKKDRDLTKAQGFLSFLRNSMSVFEGNPIYEGIDFIVKTNE